MPYSGQIKEVQIPDGTIWEIPSGGGGSSVDPATQTPLMDGTGAVGTSAKYAREDHVHPSDTSKQDTLVSGTNIKTINGQSVLGSGDIVTPDTTVDPATNAPLMDGTAVVGTSAKYAREDHVHPSDTSKQNVLTAGANITITGDTISATDTNDHRTVYAYCQTAAATVAKVAAPVSGDNLIEPGTFVGIRFAETNTASAPTIQVGSDIALPIYYNAGGTVPLFAGGEADKITYYMRGVSNWVYLGDSARCITHLLDSANDSGLRQIGATAEDSSYSVGVNAAAFGQGTRASGASAFAEGIWTNASNTAAHAEGDLTTASGAYSHAGGINSTASKTNSFAHGDNVKASSAEQAVFGKYNVEDASNTYGFIVGNGSSDSARSNAFGLTWSGTIDIPGNLRHYSPTINSTIGQTIPSENTTLGGEFDFDSTGYQTSWSETIKTTADDLYKSFILRRKNASGTELRNGFYLHIDASGTSSVAFTSAAVAKAWRDALGVRTILTKTMTATTSSTGNLNTGLAKSSYAVLAAYNIGSTTTYCTSIATNSSAANVYIHVTNANNQNVGSTSVTLVIYYMEI